MSRPPDLPEIRDYRPSLIFTFALALAMLFLVENPDDAKLNWFGLEFRQKSLWIAILVVEVYFASLAFGEKQLFQSGFWTLLKDELQLECGSQKRGMIQTVREFILVPLSVIIVLGISLYKIFFTEYS